MPTKEQIDHIRALLVHFSYDGSEAKTFDALLEELAQAEFDRDAARHSLETAMARLATVQRQLTEATMRLTGMKEAKHG